VQLHRSNFIVGNSLFPGHAKEVLHSRIAAQSHSHGNLDQMGRFGIKNPFSLNRLVETGKQSSLIFG
jgi:hypothetical protein